MVRGPGAQETGVSAQEGAHLRGETTQHEHEQRNGNWQQMPGHFDPLHIRRRHYPAANRWGFPDLLPQRFILLEPRQLLKPDGLRLRKMT